jgi:hypothetical protein
MAMVSWLGEELPQLSACRIAALRANCSWRYQENEAMTGKPTGPSRTRLFRTFTAYQYPVQPQGEVEYSEARGLSTYYEARYDDEERLIEFVKWVREGKGPKEEWLIMFTEEYQYFDNGNLQKRTLKVPGQDDQIWEFTRYQRSWSGYLDRLCNRWFRRSGGSKRPSAAQLSLLVHEQFTELEADVFEAAVGVPRDSEWAFKTTLRILPRAREIIEEIEPNAGPRICAITEGQPDGLKLEGFDEPEPSLYAVVQSWQEQHSRVGVLETITLLAKHDLDQMGRDWAAGSNIGSITFAPIQAVDNNKLAIAATLFLLTKQTLSEEKICVVNSVFRRLLQQIQNVVEMARVYEVSHRGSGWL